MGGPGEPIRASKQDRRILKIDAANMHGCSDIGGQLD
jgi:hypothetical protein